MDLYTTITYAINSTLKRGVLEAMLLYISLSHTHTLVYVCVCVSLCVCVCVRALARLWIFREIVELSFLVLSASNIQFIHSQHKLTWMTFILP